MSAQIIDGKKIAQEVVDELSFEISSLKEKGIHPGIAVVIVGNNPASVAYVNMKEKRCAQLGIYSQRYDLPETVTEAELLDLIDQLNKKDVIHGILVQLPLPKSIDEDKIIEAIVPEKDVDCFHPYNVGRMLLGKPRFLSCTPHGVQVLLARSGIAIEGKHVVIVGRSNIVGKPLAAILMQKAQHANATVTVCHSRSVDLNSITCSADILIAAIGSPFFITSDMIKPGATVIDVGINRVDDPSSPKGYRLVGDVDYDNVIDVARAITPVPGGVGPMTIAMLMKNTVEAAKLIEKS
ncbi:MAG: bifunctional methylenetetrahydrofolate dehydrogenase/methenyltetrahydrofolate cyclohydrolase FolD [Candidatus Ancaeobacter aquaticus]|nr:bifunctional methylenetetrahydrofolate dehydrogenase/methenyltetrahydrofolate cyclohydrolase FolD [Candidatus Ancaeobacter aquaticus]